MTRGPESTAHAGIDPVPRLLIVNGLPGSGKTTLSRELAPRLGLPLISKDDIKELLFDQLGWSDREQSKRFGGAAWELLWLMTERTLTGNGSLAIESSFFIEPTFRKLSEWRATRALRIVELHCTADRRLLVQRFQARALGPDRHPGHGETNLDTLEQEFIPRLLNDADALIPGTDAFLTVDTTDPSTIDLDAIVSKLRAQLWPNESS